MTNLYSNLSLDQCAIVSDEFKELLTFTSIRGNQEERIAKLTGLQWFSELPEKMNIDGATLIHGHQIYWSEGEPIEIRTDVEFPLVIFGHIHITRIFRNGEQPPLDF